MTAGLPYQGVIKMHPDRPLNPRRLKKRNDVIEFLRKDNIEGCYARSTTTCTNVLHRGRKIRGATRVHRRVVHRPRTTGSRSWWDQRRIISAPGQEA